LSHYSPSFRKAFNQFETDVDISNIRSFRPLEMAISSWAGRHYKGTPKQRSALAYEAEQRGIPVSLDEFRKEREQPHIRAKIYWIPQTFTREGKQVTVYRNRPSGRFLSRKSAREGVEPKPVVVYRDAKGRFAHAEPERGE
jgi:hypothetical protein